MIEQRLIDTKRNLQRLANESGESIEDILKLLREGIHQFKEKGNENSLSQDSADQQFSLVNNLPIGKKLIKKDKLMVDSQFNRKMKNQSVFENAEITENLLGSGMDLIQESTLQLNKSCTVIMQNIVDQMVTKKNYKIRQSFRHLVLTILGIEQMSYYLIDKSNHIQFQDFSSNFITEIMASDSRNSLIQKIINLSEEQFNIIDLYDNPAILKIFQINSTVQKGIFYGVVGKKVISQQNQTYSYCLMFKLGNKKITNLADIITNKLLIKIIQISLINSTEDSTYNISKLYAKKMLDLLQILIIRYDFKLKKSLCQLTKIKKEPYFDLINIVKIMLSKIDQNLENEQTVLGIKRLVNQFEQMQYKKIQEIRVYKKYVRQENCILLQFNRMGILYFISGNRDNEYLNDLTTLWEPNKPVLDLIFKKLKKFDDYIKKAVRGLLKSERPIEIDNQIKAKITLNGKKIYKIQIMIQKDEAQPIKSQSDKNCGQNQNTLKEKNQNNKITNHKTLKQLENQNPGILNQGWIDLFLKGNTQKIDENMEMKKRNTFIPGDKIFPTMQRQSSHSTPKQQYKSIISDFQIANPNLNFLAFNDYQLQGFIIKVFDNLDYFQNLTLQKKKLINFVSDLHDNYEIHANPFHNFRHGINVMHTAYLLSTIPANLKILTVKDIFVNVFSGLCHDVGHTGFTNAYEIASMSKKAMIYNDRSPLQNYHASLTFQILRKQQNNFICHMERQEFVKFRKAVIQNILYTDIKEHFPLLNSFNELLKSGKALGRQDAPILSYMIIHSSDFAGSVKSFQICKEWSRRVNLQFSNQYKMQGQNGLPQTPFMKDLTNPVVLSKAEGGFLKVIVYPLYQALDNLYIMQGTVRRMKKNVQDNMKGWQQIYKLETEKTKSIEQNTKNQ